MRINYNVTGAERKSLVAAISQELNAPTKYLGMPTAAYEVGGYNIDKTGTVTGPDNRELVANLQGLHSLVPVTEEYDAALPETPETPAFESLRLTEREELGLGRERRDPMGEDGMQASDVPETDETPDIDQHHPGQYADPNEAPTEEMLRQAAQWMEGQPEYNGTVEDSLAIEMPLEGFTATALDNLEKLVASKAALIKKAIGVDTLPVERTETTLRFPWFAADTPGDDINAYAQFIAALCETAKEHKRVTAKEKEVDNEKFAFRVFLIRLGFIGGEYKDARKILMRNLSGNSAFKNGAPPRPSANADEPAADETNASNTPADETPDEKISA